MFAKILIGFVALEHIYILWIEMFAWESIGKKVFKSIPTDLFEKTKALAANQGLYNGFLSAGLVWSLIEKDPTYSKKLSLFFLGCISIAGIYGAISADKKIFFKQALPALIAIILVI